MKKILSFLSVLFLSGLFAFSENYISINDMALLSLSSDTNSLNFQLFSAIEYDYVLESGFTFGGGTSVTTDFHALNILKDDAVPINVTGVGFSFYPSVGYTSKGSNVFQILAHPLIYQDIPKGISEVSTRLGNISINEDMSWTKLKTGVSASALFGWQHFKLGIGTALNIYLFDSLYSNLDISHLLEIGVMGKLSIIF